MHNGTWLIVPWLSLVVASDAAGQGVSTGNVRGTIRNARGELLTGARVEIVQRATGYRLEVDARDGRFSTVGLEAGGPYSIVARALGYTTYARDSVFLRLGQPLDIDITLSSVPTQIDTVRVLATASVRRATPMGIAARVSDEALRNLPTLNRDLYDFVQLAPEASVRSGLVSGGGTSPRYNNFLVDGVSQRHLQGSLPAGGFNGGKSLSIEAVQEYEVILSSYDVRYGDFAGAMVNAVTRRGTNQPFVSAFLFGRTEKLARNTPFLRDSPYQRSQYGFSAGGPIIRDRLHFFLAPEFQRFTAPASGPYLGQESAGQGAAPVSAADVERLVSILRRYGIDAGAAGRVIVETPLANLFGRLDLLLPTLRSHVTLSNNYNHLRADRFDRSTASTFPLSSLAWTQEIVTRTTVAQAITPARGGALNEFSLAFTDNPQRGVPRVRSPLIIVAVPNAAATGGLVSLQAGTREIAHGGGQLEQSSLEITDNLSIPIGEAHRVSLGVHAEAFALRAPGVTGSYGRWEFSSLDSLDNGSARLYTVGTGSGGARLRGNQYGAYIGDAWRANDGLDFAIGIRGDILVLRDRPPYNRAIDVTYGRRTDHLPVARLAVSPRVGFRWEMTGLAHGQLRGGAGVFAVRPPLAWPHAAMYSVGTTASLTCGRSTDVGFAPPFQPDYRLAPQTCANSLGATGGPVQLLSDDLTLLAKHFRASLAYDRSLPWGTTGTFEALYSRSLNDFLFVNLNLAGPQGVDRFGRVMYGKIPPSGIAVAATIPTRPADAIDIDIRKQSRDYGVQVVTRLEKSTRNIVLSGGYAFSHVRDVQSLTAAFPPVNNWRDGRTLSGRHESVVPGISALEVRHRAVVAATIRAPWRHATSASLYYVGESGSPFTYVATGAQGRGDLNADGSSTNDPIYVPRSAWSSAEIRFSGRPFSAGLDTSATAQAERILAQQAAFERFIAGSACLRSQRGRIVQRNSCRAPWVNTTNVSIRQTLVAGGHALTAQAEVFNVLNLLNRRWGQYRQPTVAILQHVGQTPGTGAESQSEFQFNTDMKKYSTSNIESAYQLQLALRYSF